MTLLTLPPFTPHPGQQLQCGLDLIQRERHNLLHPGVDMTRPNDRSHHMKFISLLLLALTAVAVLPTASLAQPAEPACTPASAPTPNTACGACGTGYRVGMIGLQTEQKPSLRVGVDGYWETCIVEPDITPGTACGAPGVGVLPAGARVARAEPGWRVDDRGRWVECDRPCIPPAGQHEAVRVWSEGPHTCTSLLRSSGQSSGHPSRDRVLRHGELGAWQQWTGAMRGRLVEQCEDGTRAVRQSTCAPATHCDTAWGGSDGLSYDGRQRGAAVPLGGYAQASAPDGRTRRIQCVAGAWVESPQCGAGQTVVRRYSTETRKYRYDGGPVDIGTKVRAEQVEVRYRDGRVVADPGEWRNSIRWAIATCGPGGYLR